MIDNGQIVSRIVGPVIAKKRSVPKFVLANNQPFRRKAIVADHHIGWLIGGGWQVNKYPVVALITEWRDENGNVEQRSEQSDLGGTMRLGSQQCQLTPESKVRQLYGSDVITERHRHRYEVNNLLLKPIEAAGLHIAGRSGDDQLVEIIEIPNHPWFVACQFHPEFTSTPRDGHPLFAGFVKAAQEHQKRLAK